MTAHRPSRKSIRLLCDRVGPEDGIDPRYLAKHSDRGPGRKALQLCRQVQRALQGALAESREAVLRDLAVVAVTPGGGGRLLVTLRPATESAPAALLQDHLAEAQGWLRREVAAAVHRRKAPDLVFQVQVAER